MHEVPKIQLSGGLRRYEFPQTYLQSKRGGTEVLPQAEGRRT